MKQNLIRYRLWALVMMMVVVYPDGEMMGEETVHWRPMAIRSDEELQRGMFGGEAEQHLHGLARSLSNPDVIYLSHDVGQLWRSDDNGQTWHKRLGKGMHARAGMSVEVDPLNPMRVFVVLDNAWNYHVKEWQGLYLSEDGGDSGKLVLPEEVSSTEFFHSETQRMYQHLITYDPMSLSETGAKRWYVGFAKKALYLSEDGGLNWEKTVSLEQHAPLYAIHAHPLDGKSLYMASNQGLFKSEDRGKSFERLGNLPAGEVSGLAVTPKNGNLIYAVVKGVGLFRSMNGGRSFRLLQKSDAMFVFINPQYPQVIYLTGLRGQSIASIDGGKQWYPMRGVPAPGLMRESGWKTSVGGAQAGFVGDPRDPLAAVGFSHATVYRTEDGGKILADSSTGFSGYSWGWFICPASFDVVDPKRFAFFCYDIAMVMTENGGMSFRRFRTDQRNWREWGISHGGMYAGSIQPIAGSKVIVASVGRYSDSVLVRSEDAGETWKLVDGEVGDYLFVAFNQNRPDMVYAKNKISVDGGKSFRVIRWLKEHEAQFVDMCRAQPDTVYAMNRERTEIYRTDDCGRKWRLYVQAGKNWKFGQMDSKPTFAVDPKNADVIYTLNRHGDLARYDGKKWTDFEVLKLTDNSEVRNFIRKIAIDPSRPEVIYAMANSPGLPFIFRTVDGGKTWEDITGNKARNGAGGIVVHPLTGDVLTGSMAGTWVLAPSYQSEYSIYEQLPESIEDWIEKVKR